MSENKEVKAAPEYPQLSEEELIQINEALAMRAEVYAKNARTLTDRTKIYVDSEELDKKVKALNEAFGKSKGKE